MIDIKLVRDNPDLVRASQRARGADETLVDQVLAADEKRRSSITEFESLRSQQKTVSKSVGAAMGKLNAARKAGSADVDVLAKEADEARARATELSAQVKQREAAADQEDKEFTALLRELDNIVLDGVPAGGEEDFETLETVGEPRSFDFEPLDHLALGEKLDAIDMQRGAKVSGSRFYFLKGAGARLSNALMAYAQSIAAEEGFTPLIVPTLVSAQSMGGTGYLDAHEDVYELESGELYLTGTSEVALAGFHTDEILDLSNGPLRYTATSTCYRREAGSYGKDTRGIFRVHQFTKTEMFVYCDPQQAVEEHQNLLRIERRLLDGLELPYRVIDVAAGDLGGSAARKYDCEAWVPTQGKYRELTSTSNCTTYQARRLNIRQRGEGGKTEFVATLNGTMLTDTRPIVALLENHQQADGSIRVPQALQPFLGTDVIRPA
ncbi:serine--tRNA ligase [Flexivirga endophytica]|uniref:Serine--tRNA ligase n=1 Tax=Flexivirga endophytica TaxID=1849103 RepID=A0A916WUH2_9MICO|nr:serine--tRNA ligase [Flexivirga endophytica]GGB30904.1 serine--tRNA ligase [Flexivirga endophytica]GHB51830.1 serine--tRNA ligase [Flexivirga endophytica]